MEAIWFALIAFMLTAYVVLDGFDFGAGIAHLYVARTDEERRTVLAAIGPVWDGNEVWLIAGGGTLFFAFPKAYASGFSGFYLPLMLVLWLLILRGVSIEFRSQIENPLWRTFWDAVFAFSSFSIAIVLGAALGNVLRGVPIEESGYFRGTLFTNFAIGSGSGALDWYTVLIGLFALATLGLHGSLYLNWKTQGPVQERSARLTRILLVITLILGAVATAATATVEPQIYLQLRHRPAAWALALTAAAGFINIALALRRGHELRAFLGSTALIAGLLGATAACLYPTLLRSTIDPAYTVNAFNAATAHHGLAVGLMWWIPAIVVAIGYFVHLFRSFRGKVTASNESH